MVDKKHRRGKPRITDKDQTGQQAEHPQVIEQRVVRQVKREFREEVVDRMARKGRMARSSAPDPSKGSEPANTKFQFTSDQRREILGNLPKQSRGELDDTAREEIMGRVELVVSLAWESLGYRKSHPVPGAKFRGLKGHIEPILSVLDAPAFKFLEEQLPNLRREFRVLQTMVDLDQHPPNRPPAGERDRIDFAIQQLANIWMECGGSVPKDAKPTAPFYRFLAACLDPAGIEISRYAINVATRNL